MSESVKCKRCGAKLTNPESIKLGYGRVCYNLIHLESKLSVLDELLNRVRLLELDNNFMKTQLKHKKFTNEHSADRELDWELKPKVKQRRDETKIVFNVIIKELKLIFTNDFDYHDILKPIVN